MRVNRVRYSCRLSSGLSGVRTLIFIPTILVFATVLSSSVEAEIDQASGSPRSRQFRHNGSLGDEGPSSFGMFTNQFTEAPAAFDNLSNGMMKQGKAMNKLTAKSARAGRSFNDDRIIFEEVETMSNGLGPTYNAQSCRECHQNVVTGGGSQITEFRSGHTKHGEFFDSLGGSLIQSVDRRISNACSKSGWIAS